MCKNLIISDGSPKFSSHFVLGGERAYCASLSTLCGRSIVIWIPTILLVLRVRHDGRSIDMGSMVAIVLSLSNARTGMTSSRAVKADGVKRDEMNAIYPVGSPGSVL